MTGVDDAWNTKEQTVYEFAILLNKIHIGAVSQYIDHEKIGELG